MKSTTSIAGAVVLTAWMAATGAAAQTVYRCGDSYGQQPCPGGKTVQTDDARSDAQKRQTSDAAKRDGKTADVMEKDRLKQEAQAAPAYIPPPKPVASPEENRPLVTTPVKQKYFTAVAPRKPGEAKKKKKSKKKTE